VLIIFILSITMGQMCTNPLEYLTAEYGDDVGKFIVVEKTKQYFDEKYPEVKQSLNLQTTNFQKEALHQVDEQSASCLTKITASLDELKASKKTEIELFEKTSNKKVDDFVGVGALQTKIDGLKDQSKVKLAGLEKSILGEADVLADKQRGAIEAQKPSIPLYDNLPQCLKDKVWEEGEKKFGEKINAEKTKQEELLKKTLNFDELKKKFGGDLPTDEITHLSSSAEEKLGDVKKAIAIGNPLDKIKSFF
jgi:hypothetical protein